mgnify:CR=1 FL=1
MTARNIDIMNFSDIAYCSDKYQYTMGKSFYESGKSLFRKDYFWKYFFQSPWKPAP